MDKTTLKLLIMILTFILIVANIVFEVENHFNLTDFQILLVAMFVVSVLPALGGVFYKWMNAENEPEESQEVLRAKRTNICMPIAVVLILILSAYDIVKYLL